LQQKLAIKRTPARLGGPENERLWVICEGEFAYRRWLCFLPKRAESFKVVDAQDRMLEKIYFFSF
jgi:hypothetical protein